MATLRSFQLHIYMFQLGWGLVKKKNGDHKLGIQPGHPLDASVTTGN